jgi:LacI family transcriptional regulator
MKKKEVTIYDIAHELSLSSSTVSRSLQNHPAINKSTKQKVVKKAKELGYRYNNFAGSLRKQKTHTIGFLVHELRSHFITSVLAGIEKITTAAGYDLLIAHSSESKAKEIANTVNFYNKRVDGLIASLALETENLDHFKPFNEKGIPLIFFDRVEEDNVANMSVVIDNFKAGYDAAQHLISQGCKRLVMVTSSLRRNVYKQRFEGFKAALAANGQKFSPNQLIINDLSEEAAVQSAGIILGMQPLPDGVFLTNDFTAAVCMNVFKENGIHVPEDIAIVGFNNDPVSKLVNPGITTINYSGKDIGEIIASNMIAQLNKVEALQHANRIIVRSDLIVRGSSMRMGDIDSR